MRRRVYDTIAKLRTQQYGTRKNDEFQAMGNEIKRYEDEIRKIEDEELEIMDETDKAKAEVGTEEKKTGQVTDSITRQMADLETKRKDTRPALAGAGHRARSAGHANR